MKYFETFKSDILYSFNNVSYTQEIDYNDIYLFWSLLIIFGIIVINYLWN